MIMNDELNKLNLGKQEHCILELYAMDMIYIYKHDLNIDNSTSSSVIKLSAAFLILLCTIWKGTDMISIADLECIMWTQHQLLMNVNKILNILDDDKLNDIQIKYHNSIDTFIENIKLILWHLLQTLKHDNNKDEDEKDDKQNDNKHTKYGLYNLYTIEKSILYIIHFIDINFNDKCQAMIEQLNCIKLQCIVIKNNLNNPDDDIEEII